MQQWTSDEKAKLESLRQRQGEMLDKIEPMRRALHAEEGRLFEVEADLRFLTNQMARRVRVHDREGLGVPGRADGLIAVRFDDRSRRHVKIEDLEFLEPAPK
jgi:hypothetical protein